VSASTRQNDRFQKYARLARLADIRQAVLHGLARLAHIRQAVLHGLARLADIRQAVLGGLARLAKGEFGECYANLASLANLASVD
jgi:predicted transcriptional regulator